MTEWEKKQREEKAKRLKLLDGFAEGLKPMARLHGASGQSQVFAALGDFAKGLQPLLAELRKDMADD